MRQHDTNADGKIDIHDAIYEKLNIWVDSNVDGITNEGELKTLAELDIASINLTSISSDETDNGNLLSLMGSYTSKDGEVHEYADVWFKQGAKFDPSTTSDISLTDGQNHTITHDPRPSFEGDAEPGALVAFSILDDTFSTRADQNGHWHLTLPSDRVLAQGDNAFTVAITHEDTTDVKTGTVSLIPRHPKSISVMLIACMRETRLSEAAITIHGMQEQQ
ncbi:hypothetical protein CS022_19500 [Veronia nyctiphanis]|uniref:Uncharacterized protein n=1 Tax=Veronia nyctiphanis TaxID=1278244 RepID=A0A4Q0YM25_9GAMM|nr:hypothetical protein [Veronia nyctiphanis]RXJ71850.1 hypothetical protein CS022_19500 [Veronia nyctiphanis]